MKKYKIVNEKNVLVSEGLLNLFFGNLWEMALDRLDHQFDGYLMTITYQKHHFRVYRLITLL